MQFYVPLPNSTSFIEKSLLRNSVAASKIEYVLVKRLQNTFFDKKKEKN